MRRPATTTDEVVHACINGTKDEDLKLRVLAQLDVLRENAERYIEAALDDELWQLVPADFPVSCVDNDEFIWLYEQRLVAKSSTGRSVYEALLANATLARCPYCNVNTPKTLDHFLPKRPFGTLAIEPVNLIPACRDCNSILGSHVGSTIASSLFHPYFAPVLDEWLHVEVIPSAGLSVRFFPRPPENWPTLRKERLEWVFAKLGLADLYGSVAGGALAELTFQLRRLHVAGGPSLVREHLLDLAVTVAHVGPNQWRAALYNALAADSWYCGGGFAFEWSVT